MNLFRFAQPEYLYALALIPVLLTAYLWYQSVRKRKLRQLGPDSLIYPLMPEQSSTGRHWKLALQLAAFLFLIIMMARPQYGSKLEEVKRKSAEIIIALDISNSMLAEDIAPSRLERSKQALSKLIDKLGTDRIGLVVFAGDAYTQLPITADYVSAKMFLSTIHPGIIAKQGTAIGAAINLAAASFDPRTETGKAIIVISDGENHEDDAIGAAREAADKGIVVHTIGMGLPQGAPIPAMAGSTSDFIKDRQGNVVISKLDEKMLAEIAAAGNGVFVRAGNASTGLEMVYGEINKLYRSETTSTTFAEYNDQFIYFAVFALFLLLTETLLPEKKWKWATGIRLFDIRDKRKI